MKWLSNCFPPVRPTSGFCRLKERGSINECIYIYIYILVIISSIFISFLHLFLVEQSSTSGFDNFEMEKWKTCLRERMRKVSFRLTKGKTTFNQGCVISDPIPLPVSTEVYREVVPPFRKVPLRYIDIVYTGTCICVSQDKLRFRLYKEEGRWYNIMLV